MENGFVSAEFDRLSSGIIGFTLYSLVAFGLLAHLLFWGAGAAWWLAPRRWRKFWPVFCAPAGILLQSLVVWGGAYANLPGTNSYGRWSLLVPALLLVTAWRRSGGGMGRQLVAFGGLGVAMAACVLALVTPLSRAARTLTTASLGSCDAADYAAGARVLQEFARNDRSGFLGLSEVAGVGSTDNFYDFWLRLNHFTPSALMALDSTVLGLAPHQVAGLLTVVLLAASLPLVWWLARTLVRLRPAAALLTALLYGFSPVTWYAVCHVATAQLIAAQAIALLTWGGIVLWRRRKLPTQALALGGAMFVGYSLVLGAYNFMLLVCLVPALAFVGGSAVARGDWAGLMRWFVRALWPLVPAGLLQLERVLGLVERFRLFRQHDFGWRIPALTPEGWLGMVADEGLNALPGAGRWLLAAGVVGLVLLALWRRRAPPWMVVALTAPVLAGYVFLQVRGAMAGTNASYDAYKLLAVFFPGLLAAACAWLGLIATRERGRRVAAVIFCAAVVAFTARTAWKFGDRMAQAPLIVHRDLADLQALERHGGITSLNMRVEDFWTRLWANAFLLRRPQYFLTHTYEGRLNTALRGDWDLNGGLIRVRVPDEREGVVVNRRFSAIDTRSRHYLRAEFGDGWFDIERVARAGELWRWAGASGFWRVHNPQTRPLTVTMRVEARSLVEREVELVVAGRVSDRARIGTKLATVVLPPLVVPPGETVVELRCRERPRPAGAGDARTLGFAVYGVEFAVGAGENSAP